MIYTEGRSLLRYNLRQKEYRLPESIIYVGNGAFQNNESLVSLTLHDNVRTIGDYAMRNCRSLSRVTLPAAVTSFGIGVFTNCVNLGSVSLPSGVIAVDHLTFRGCRGLREVGIPDSVQGISPRAFETCARLSSIIISPCRLELLSGKTALMAARTFMHANPSGSDSYINSFVSTHHDSVIKDCLAQGDRAAFSYLMQNDLFTTSSISRTIELARQMNLTDICAMLLSYQHRHAPADSASFRFKDL